jgi:ribosomal protein L11 methyltransferase
MTDYGVLEAEVPEESAELWDLWCSELGASGSEWMTGPDVQVPDDAVRPHPPPVPAAPGCVRIRHYFEVFPNGTPDTWLQGYRERFPAAPPIRSITWKVRPVEEWASQWRQHFAPLKIGKRFLICPPWDDGSALDDPPPAPRRLRIVIDPGQGFGTGRHASTALALELLERAIGTGNIPAPASMLDAGTGSGILMIGARLLGVPQGWAIDIDARVGPEVRNNLRLSGLAPDARLAIGTPAAMRREFPLVTANITAPVLMANAADWVRLTSPGGHLILSGMLADEIGPVLSELTARARGTAWIEAGRAQSEGWAALWLRRPD